MTSAHAYFASDYVEARRKFHEACAARGLAVESHRHPGHGPDGESLTMDEAWIGATDAERVLVVCSATHGAEGFLGSALQVGWLESGLAQELPHGLALLMVHALNPHGFAWVRRVDAANIDLNRNFIDHGSPPENPGYDELAAAICPPSVDDAAMAESKKTLEAYKAAHGTTAWLQALVGGQYRHADGIYYGGAGPAWSNRIYRAILARRLRRARQVGSIDLHSGLGDHGYGAPISCHERGSPGYRRLLDWYGDAVDSAADEDSTAFKTTGDTSEAVVGAAPQAEVTAVCLEYGTRPEWQVFDAIRRDNWLYLHGDPDSPQGRAIKAELRDAFYPHEAEWKDKVWARAVEILRQAVRGLSAGG